MKLLRRDRRVGARGASVPLLRASAVVPTIRTSVLTAMTGPYREVAGLSGRAMRLAAIFFAVLSTPALASPSSGVYPDDAEHAWWACHLQPATKVVCCRASDGHVLGDNEWRVVEKPNGARAYQVSVGAKWHHVPAKAVINDFRHCGSGPNLAHRSMAKVWYAPTWVVDKIVDIQIYCFIAGTMY